MNAPTEFRDGVNVALARVRFRLTARHRTDPPGAKPLIADSENYDALSDGLRPQLIELGYQFLGIVPIGAADMAA